MSTTVASTTSAADGAQNREVREPVVVRFAGDSGDGMQLTGSQFTLETALAGLDLTTFPDYPAEIRAPVGTTFGVSAFQIHFGSIDVKTAGDEVDVLVAMNPAALMVNLVNLRLGGTIVADVGSFNERNLTKAGYEANPLEDDLLVQVIDVSSPYAVEQARVVSDQLSDMGIADTPRVLVLNKLDLVVDTPDEPLALDVLGRIDVAEFKRVVTTSATKSWGIDDLRNAIDTAVVAVDHEERATAIR